MEYILEMDKGNKVVCKFKNKQEDYMENSWYQETWYKKENEKLYVCEYLDCDFTTEHKKEDARFLLRDTERLLDESEVVIEIFHKDGSQEIVLSDSEEYKLYLTLAEKYNDKVLNK